MNFNTTKSQNYINQKYVELLERSNKDLHNRGKFFSKKNLIIISGLFIFLLGVYSLFTELQDKNDYFDKYLSEVNYNTHDLLIENQQGVFFKIDENTNAKWLTGNDILININANEIQFIATNHNSLNYLNKYTIHTPANRLYSLVLTDGTKIKINENSKLEFINQRNGIKPSVFIDGEAFFEVAHSDNKNFKIGFNESIIEVFGTSFNVSNYHDNLFSQVALVEGSIKLYDKKQTKFIKPGEIASVSPNHSGIDISNAAIDEVLFWAQEEMYFTDEALPKLLNKIEKWYGVSFIIEYAPISQLHFTGNVRKNDGLESFLNMLVYTENISFQIENNNIKLNKPNK